MKAVAIIIAVFLSLQVGSQATSGSVSSVELPARGGTGFVYSQNGNLVTNGGEPYNFATFNSPHLLTCTTFEAEDTMRTLQGFARPVTRTYTLSVASLNVDPSDAHVQGWDNNTRDWIYNENLFVKFDQMLDIATNFDVKIIHPIINQDYGDESSNFVGNWADLIRMRYNLASYDATKAIDWWRDPVMISAYKLIISHLLNRVNTINGKRYGSDPTFLAFETGNEMNDGGSMPPPGNWTIQVAKHIKSLAPNILVMDGSLSRNDSTQASWAAEALHAPEVDIHSYHYYRDNPAAYDYRRIGSDSAYVRSFGKTFVVGEHGFYSNASEFSDFFRRQKAAQAAGSMVWSIRPHAENGGFLTHGEGDGIFSYHAPGWVPVEADFDPLEKPVIHITRAASYDILSTRAPPLFPIPIAPILASVEGLNVSPHLTWKGAAWAEHYELCSPSKTGGRCALINGSLFDNLDAGSVSFPCQHGSQFKLRGISVDGLPGPYSTTVEC
ncbi:glycoside hydrolase superfamily [Infundibulicybe gibba]|nr:glycoside hydrolase superfamily [Infundibulicybe gibba]